MVCRGEGLGHSHVFTQPKREGGGRRDFKRVFQRTEKGRGQVPEKLGKVGGLVTEMKSLSSFIKGPGETTVAQNTGGGGVVLSRGHFQDTKERSPVLRKVRGEANGKKKE